MLEGILSETYGVIIYQEQVIQIAQVMGGYSLGQADMLRRAMGKKDKAEMARHEARFVEGAIERGVKKKDAAFIFELLNKFAGYGFKQIACGRLCVGQLSHRLHESEFPGGIFGRLDDFGSGEYRQACRVCSGS